ncbi:MAG: nucleotide disphospho-sugar-binding domain-containing protein, partial [Dongiaceae bacterium]
MEPRRSRDLGSAASVYRQECRRKRGRSFLDNRKLGQMKIILASTPSTGHLNPLLAIGRILIAEGHEVVGLTGTALRDRIEGIGAQFHPLPAAADMDLRDVPALFPELNDIPPGPEHLRVQIERIFVDPIPAQYEGLRQVLQHFPADVIVGEDMFFGVLPMLLGPRSQRPPIVLCGTSFLHCRRQDGAPHNVGFPPPTNQAERDECAAIAREYDRVFEQPVSLSVNSCLKSLGVRSLPTTLHSSGVELADAFLQLTVPSFELPCDLPPSVHFVGTPPIIPNQVALPAWAHELDGSRKVVLVTQGTVATNFDHLVGPALAALADETDLLMIATAGGRPVDAIPGPIPANARLASYLPFESVLPKVDAFVTNGGYGSVNQALSFGIPLVTAGLTEDKADVNVRVGWSGVGINLATNAPRPQ